MKANLLPAFVFCAVLLMEVRAEDQTSSGYNAEGYTSSGDDAYDSSEGSGSTGQEVQKVIDAMRKLNKNKSDDDLSKNIKTGKILRNLPLRTFEKLSALWISIIRRLWKVWKAKGARQVMHSIVEKLVTHTGKKVSNKVGKLLNQNSETGTESMMQKSAMPIEKNSLDQTSQNVTSTYAHPGSDNPGDEDSDKDDKPAYDQSRASAADTYTQGQGSNNPVTAKQTASGSTEEALYPQNKKRENQMSLPSTVAAQMGPGNENTADTSSAEKVAGSKSEGLTSSADNSAFAEKQTNKGDQERREGNLDSGSGGRNMIPQEQTPESITANIGQPAEAALHKASKKIKHVKNKKRYKMHKHTHRANKSFKHNTKQQKETRVRYKNVDKHLIKRGKGPSPPVPSSKIGWTQGSAYVAPISKELESVLNVRAAQEKDYSKPKVNTAHRKRSFPAEIRRSHIEAADYDDYDYDYHYDDSGDDSSGTTANSHSHGSGRGVSKEPAKSLKGKKKRLSKKAKYLRTGGSKHRSASKNSKQNSQVSARFTNKTLPTKAAKYEAPVRKFKFFGAPRTEVLTANATAVPMLSIESSPSKEPMMKEGPSANDVDQPQVQQPSQPWPFKQIEQPETHGQPGTIVPFTPDDQPESPSQEPPILVLPRPTIQQTTDGVSPIIIPTSSGKPIVPIIPSEPPTLPGEDDTPVDDEPVGNSTSFIPTEENVGPTVESNALTEELKSLESRMTVVEAAVAEIIEWIRTRTNIPSREPVLPQESNFIPSDEPAVPPGVSLRPAAPYQRLKPPVEELIPPQEFTPHRPRVLKQIFIPLPPPNTEAEKEIENGGPVNGLPFPLNFIVAKVLAKMLKERDEKIVAASHPHTPVPDVDIPAIEHDINRLELELGQVPKPFHHHRHHHFKIHRPADDERVKGPLIDQLLSTEPEAEGPGCSSPCQNGGVCMGDNICRCPSPFSGPTCGSMTLVKVAKPTTRVVIETPEANILEALRRRALARYGDRYLPPQIRDHRDRRRLINVLKGLLRNIATESMRPEYMRRSDIEMDNARPEVMTQENVAPLVHGG